MDMEERPIQFLKKIMFPFCKKKDDIEHLVWIAIDKKVLGAVSTSYPYSPLQQPECPGSVELSVNL